MQSDTLKIHTIPEDTSLKSAHLNICCATF